MTALDTYQRLEASGLWRAHSGAEQRDAIVSLGSATLSISDGMERPLAHWSLPAIERRNPGELPAIFSPGEDATETLEIDDRDMIAAIETVHRAIAGRGPRPGWVRGIVLGVSLIALLLGGALWLPGALVRHATAVAGPVIRADTGSRLLREIARVAGAPCDNGVARAALSRLARRVLGPGAGQIIVLPGGIGPARHLPGELILLDRATIENSDGPEAVAGYLMAERVRASAADPMARILDQAGPWAAVQILARGEISDPTLARYADAVLSDDPEPLPIQQFIEEMANAGISATPYARTVEATDETAGPIIEGDRVPPGSGRAVLSDAEWRALRKICAP